MLNNCDISGFAIESGIGGKEIMAISLFANQFKIPCKIIQSPKLSPPNYIPVGSVEWCLKFLKNPVTPDYYPPFLSDYLYRKVWKTDNWPLGSKKFIKPADKYKRFTGFVTNGGYRGKKRGPYWCSDVVTFTNEWRYYIANGEILTGEWYWGDEVNTPDAPVLIISLPDDYCGALDFGTLSDGRIALVEANHPFACGWYGKEHNKYAEWIIKGWTYMIKLDTLRP